MTKMLLTLNTGSSSVKFRLFGLREGLPLLAGGKVSGLGETPIFKANIEKDAATGTNLPVAATHEDAVLTILEWLRANTAAMGTVTAVAHRIVHGGERYAAPVLLTGEAVAYLQNLTSLAPLHQPHNLAGVSLLARHLPGVAQYGCFDTAFHANREELHTVFALPESIRNRGVRRFGFHGLSYDWIGHTLRNDYPHLLEKNVVAAHLGNGASLCAMRDGRSVDTTMGFTALDGLPMGTRCGALDPGVIFHLHRELGFSLLDIERILYEESGLKGLSGISNDAKTLAESGKERARFALGYFAHKTAQNIAAMAVSLGGLDALVFTGGIGENAEGVRAAILGELTFLPPFETLVIPANEERGMAQEIYETFKEEL